MAIVGTVAGQHESKWGISEETTFGAAIADTGNFERLMGPIPTVDKGVIKMNDVKGGDGRMRNASNDFHSEAGGLRVISFSDLFVNLEDLGLLLYLVCQNVSEGGAAAFEKTYTLSTSTTQPDFSSNAGSFVTLGIYDTIASYERKYTSCILRTLTLSADLTGDGLLRASGEFISGFAQSTTANFNTGTWNYNTQTHFNFNIPTAKKIGGSDIVLYGFDITINNNAVRTGADTSGDAETYSLATTEAGYDVTGNIKCKYDTNVQGLFAADIANTSTAIQLACGTDGASGNFDYTASANIITESDKDYGDVRGQAIDVPFVGQSSVVFTCSDANDRSW